MKNNFHAILIFAIAVAIGSTPALANHVDTANVTDDCNGYTIALSASALSSGTNYTLSWQINGLSQTITDQVHFKATGSTYSTTVTKTWSSYGVSPSGTPSLSGTASLVGQNTIAISFTPTQLSCSTTTPPPTTVATTTPPPTTVHTTTPPPTTVHTTTPPLTTVATTTPPPPTTVATTTAPSTTVATTTQPSTTQSPTTAPPTTGAQTTPSSGSNTGLIVGLTVGIGVPVILGAIIGGIALYRCQKAGAADPAVQQGVP